MGRPQLLGRRWMGARAPLKVPIVESENQKRRSDEPQLTRKSQRTPPLQNRPGVLPETCPKGRLYFSSNCRTNPHVAHLARTSGTNLPVLSPDQSRYTKRETRTQRLWRPPSCSAPPLSQGNAAAVSIAVSEAFPPLVWTKDVLV